jgi:hypothetical protein
VQLWRELYAMYMSGFDYTILKEDIQELNQSTDAFKHSTPEEDLIHQKLSPANSESYGEWMSLTEIQQYLMIETKFNYLNIQRIGSILTSLGYRQERKRRGESIVRMYFINKNPL